MTCKAVFQPTKDRFFAPYIACGFAKVSPAQKILIDYISTLKGANLTTVALSADSLRMNILYKQCLIGVEYGGRANDS
jgi:hypothetical protein